MDFPRRELALVGEATFSDRREVVGVYRGARLWLLGVGCDGGTKQLVEGHLNGARIGTCKDMGVESKGVGM